MKLNRRKFLAGALVGAGTLALLPSARLPAAEAAAANPYELVPLGKTGLKVSRIGFGTGMRGGNRQTNQTRLGKDVFEGLLKEAYDRGVRLFDMADMYGTHEFVGRAMKANRDKCVFITKIWVRKGGIPEAERPDADVLADRFRKELGTDYIDVVQIHCMSTPAWPEEQKRYLDKLEALKAKGVIRAHGVSIHSLDALKTAAVTPWVDTVHARINALGDCMDGPVENVVPVLADMHKAGKGVIGMKLVGEGRYRDSPEKRDQSIRHVLGMGTVDTMVVGFEKVSEIDDFAQRLAAALAARVKG